MLDKTTAVPDRRCPLCGYTAFAGRKCAGCGFRFSVPVNPGKPGKGSKCPLCGSFAVFGTRYGDRCEACGARFIGREADKKHD